MPQLGLTIATCVASVLFFTGAHAQNCAPEQTERDGYLFLEFGQFNASCVKGGIRCQIESKAPLGTELFRVVRVVDGARQANWAAEVYAPRQVADPTKGIKVQSDSSILSRPGSEIAEFDFRSYRITLTPAFVDALRSGSELTWTLKSPQDVDIALKFSLSGSSKTMNWIECVQKATGYGKSCVVSNVRNEWVRRHRAMGEADSVLNRLSAQVGSYSLDDFGHAGLSNEIKQKLREQAVKLFDKETRPAFNSLLESIAVRTTRACEVCRLRDLYSLAEKAGVGETITEDQLAAIESADSDRRYIFNTLKNKQEQLNTENAWLDAHVITDDGYPTHLAARNALVTEVADYRRRLFEGLPTPAGPPFKSVISGFSC